MFDQRGNRRNSVRRRMGTRKAYQPGCQTTSPSVLGNFATPIRHHLCVTGISTTVVVVVAIVTVTTASILQSLVHKSPVQSITGGCRSQTHDAYCHYETDSTSIPRIDKSTTSTTTTTNLNTTQQLQKSSGRTLQGGRRYGGLGRTRQPGTVHGVAARGLPTTARRGSDGVQRWQSHPRRLLVLRAPTRPRTVSIRPNRGLPRGQLPTKPATRSGQVPLEGRTTIRRKLFQRRTTRRGYLFVSQRGRLRRQL